MFTPRNIASLFFILIISGLFQILYHAIGYAETTNQYKCGTVVAFSEIRNKEYEVNLLVDKKLIKAKINDESMYKNKVICTTIPQEKNMLILFFCETFFLCIVIFFIIIFISCFYGAIIETDYFED